MIFSLLALFAFSAKAKNLFIYGALQAQRSYTELGHSNDGEIRYVHDFERSAYGLGAEWRFSDEGDFFFGAGALYQHAIKVKQNTTFKNQDQDPRSFTSRDDLQHIALLHGYFNAYKRVHENLKFFIGVQATVPDLRSHGRFDKYRLDNGLGYRTGLEMDLSKAWSSQLYYRHALLDTEDANGYKGELNISSLMFALGRRF